MLVGEAEDGVLISKVVMVFALYNIIKNNFYCSIKKKEGLTPSFF
jgi:hypothetical protein